MRPNSFTNATSTEHGQPGQLNAYVLDVDDECTGNGRHRRCQVYGDLDEHKTLSGVTVTCDLDAPHLTHLPEPLPSQARAVAMGERRVHERGMRLGYFGQSRWRNPNNGHAMLDFIFGRGDVSCRRPASWPS